MEPLPDIPQSDSDFITASNLGYLWLLYAIYVVSGILVLFPSQTIPAFVAITLAMIMTRIKRHEKHAVLATHYQWLRRTFWIGFGVYLSVVTALALAIAAPSIDTNAFMEAMMSGQATTTEELNDLLMAQQPQSNRYMIIGLGVVFALWWLWRCGYGMLALHAQRAIKRPDSWV